MKKLFWNVGLVAYLMAGCTASGNSDHSSDKSASDTNTAQETTPTQVTYESITDANSGATGLGVKPLEMNPAEAKAKTLEFLKGSMPFYVATLDNGLPRARPTGVITFFQDKIWFHVGQSKGVYQQILKNPSVEIVATGKNREWIRISGAATCVEDEAVTNQALDARPHLKNMYNEQTGEKLGNFYFEHALVEISKADNTVESFKW